MGGESFAEEDDFCDDDGVDEVDGAAGHWGVIILIMERRGLE